MIDVTSLGANRYHLGCLAAPVNRGRQHNNEKVIRKKKSNCQSITTSDLISHKQNSTTRLEESVLQKAYWQSSKTYTLCALLTADTQVKEVLLVFDEDIR